MFKTANERLARVRAIAEPREALVLTARRRVLWANAAAERFFALRGAELRGMLMREIVAAPPKLLAEVCRSVTRSGYRVGAVGILTGRGERVPARYYAVSIGGESLHLVAFHRASDASGDSELRTGAPARGIDRESELTAEIAASVAHEIRTPVATALMYLAVVARALEADARPGIVGSALRTAQSEISRVDELVRRVTEIQVLGSPVLHPRLLDLGSVVRETVSRATAGEAAGLVSTEIVGDEFHDWWDDIAVGQIVENLVSNAIKFGEERRIDVALSKLDDGACLAVRDRGIGMSPSKQLGMFDRRARSPLARADGLGLGLWLVRLLAEAHRGSVAVRSRAGRGSTFTVTLRPLPR